MSNDFFRFKQFTVRQSGAAMKVGVDSVLLGSWACVNHAVRILDVGAGTGLLSLMMAQRYPDAVIDAVEIDREASQQAIENCTNSPWSNRIRVICDNFIQYAAHCSLHYDLIVSNPPYFTASLQPVDAKRNIARHNDCLPHNCLLAGSARLLAPAGVLAIVLPPADAMRLIDKAAEYDLFVKRTLHVQSLPAKPVYRIHVELSKKEYSRDDQVLCIEKTDRSGTTDAYKQLTKDFYLDKN